MTFFIKACFQCKHIILIEVETLKLLKLRQQSLNSLIVRSTQKYLHMASVYIGLHMASTYICLHMASTYKCLHMATYVYTWQVYMSTHGKYLPARNIAAAKASTQLSVQGLP